MSTTEGSLNSVQWMRKDNDPGLRDLIAYTGRDHMIMIEVGSYAGESAAMFLATGKVDKIYCVDPWLPGYDTSDPASRSDSLLAAEREFDRRFINDERVVKVKSTVQAAIDSGTVPGHVDLVYIDGCHTYSCVMADIAATNGMCDILAGHDITNRNVSRAITDSLQRAPDKTFTDGSWVFMS